MSCRWSGGAGRSGLGVHVLYLNSNKITTCVCLCAEQFRVGTVVVGFKQEETQSESDGVVCCLMRTYLTRWSISGHCSLVSFVSADCLLVSA